MLTKTVLLLILGLLPTCLKAQYISPTDLLQMHRYWQAKDPEFNKNTYKYLATVDKRWVPQAAPTINDKGYTMVLGYAKEDKKWFQPGECLMMFTIDRGTLKKSILYQFTEQDTWLEYKKQMELMNAVRLGGGPNEGGQQTIYQVNDIVFILIEFPPGVVGIDRTYQVTLMHG
jgi:hypothetical protein